MEPIGCPEMSVRNYHYSLLSNISYERFGRRSILISKGLINLTFRNRASYI
jgi:hypothetical protein